MQNNRHRVQIYLLKIPFIFFILFTITLFITTACSTNQTLNEKWSSQIERRLQEVNTVQGKLDITMGHVTLKQELWVQRPDFLRTETELGPNQFMGTIVVLNETDGWVYSPFLKLVTVVDRVQMNGADDTAAPTEIDSQRAGSQLERMPEQIAQLIQSDVQINEVGTETVANRKTTHLAMIVSEDSPVSSTVSDGGFPPGALHVWLDNRYAYPLAVRDSNGRHIRFTDVQFNYAIDPITFTFVPPPGVPVRRVEP